MPSPAHLRSIALLSAAALGLAACGSSGSAVASETPVEGGELVFADIELVTDYQTQRALNYTQANIFRSFYDRLTDIDPETGEVVPWIASAWTVSEDSTEYVFTIRDGVTFSNGEPLDAEAVKANLDLLGSGDAEEGIVPNRDFIGFESAEAEGDEVTVHLSEPNRDFLRATAAATASLVSPSTLALDYEGQADLAQAVGSGPFVFEAEQPDQEISFTQREDYAWPSSISDNQGAAHLDRIVFRGIGEVGLRPGAATSGQVDVARGIQPTDEAGVEAGDASIIAVPTPDLTANWIAFRPGAAVVEDEAVRRALQIGWDREGLKTTVLSDSYELSGSVLNRTAPGFTDLGEDIAYDPEEAARLLDEAGWRPGDDGIREKDGQRLEVAIAASPRSVVIRPAVEYLEAQWRQLGVALTNNAGDSAALTRAQADPEYTAVGSRQFYQGGLGPLFSGAGNTNTYADDPELNAIFEQQREARDDAEWEASLEQAQRRLVVDTSTVIPLWDEVQVHAVAAGTSITFDGSSAPLLQEAWVTP